MTEAVMHGRALATGPRTPSEPQKLRAAEGRKMRAMKPFVVNRFGRLVFPSNFFPELDFTVFEAVIARDFETKAPTCSDILQRVESGGYPSRHELLRDLALNLLWVNRYAI